MTAKDMEENDEIEVKRPRRSCVLIESKLTTKCEDSEDDFSEESEKDNDKDEDFTLNKPKKPKPKSAKKLKNKKEKTPGKIIKEAPSWNQVEMAHRNHEQKYVEHYSSSEEYIEEEGEEEDEQIIEQPILKPEPVTEPVKKKKIVIRPWNPGWYTIPH